MFGLTCDPFNDFRFASYAEDGFLRIWDSRSPTTPILSIPSEFRLGLSCLSWCPTKSNLISASGKDCPLIRFWNLDEVGDIADTQQQTNTETNLQAESSNDIEGSTIPSVLQNMNMEFKSPFAQHSQALTVLSTRTVKPSDSDINHFRWLASDMSMCVCSGKEWRVDLFCVPSVRCCSWSPDGSLFVNRNSDMYGYTCKSRDSTDHNKKTESPTLGVGNWEPDVSELMGSRARLGYALSVPHPNKAEKNLNVIKDDDYLYGAWQFIHNVQGSLTGTFDVDGVRYDLVGMLKIVQSMPISPCTLN